MAVLITGDGARLPVINRRVTPQDTGNYMIRTDTIPVVEYPEDARLSYSRLYERPLTDYSGTGIIVRNAETMAQMSASITFPPSPGTYFINPYIGLIFFAVIHVNNKVVVTYTGMGSLVVAEDINWCFEHAKSAATPRAEGTLKIAGNSEHSLKGTVIQCIWEVDSVDPTKCVLNPPDVEVATYDFPDTYLLRSVIKNKSSAERVFTYKTLPLLKPEW